MFETMKIACLVQGGIHENEQRISAKDVIKMATINGAKLLGLEEKVGSIEVRKRCRSYYSRYQKKFRQYYNVT